MTNEKIIEVCARYETALRPIFNNNARLDHVLNRMIPLVRSCPHLHQTFPGTPINTCLDCGADIDSSASPVPCPSAKATAIASQIIDYLEGDARLETVAGDVIALGKIIDSASPDSAVSGSTDSGDADPQKGMSLYWRNRGKTLADRRQGKTFQRSDGVLACDQCCFGDRCDERGHFDRDSCPYCLGTGINAAEFPSTPVHLDDEAVANAIAKRFFSLRPEVSDLREAVAQALLAEREACAKIGFDTVMAVDASEYNYSAFQEAAMVSANIRNLAIRKRRGDSK